MNPRVYIHFGFGGFFAGPDPNESIDITNPTDQRSWVWFGGFPEYPTDQDLEDLILKYGMADPHVWNCETEQWEKP